MPSSFPFPDFLSSDTWAQWGSNASEIIKNTLGWKGTLLIVAGSAGLLLVARAVYLNRQQKQLLKNVETLHQQLTHFTQNFKLPSIYIEAQGGINSRTISPALQQLLTQLKDKLRERDTLLAHLEQFKKLETSLDQQHVEIKEREIKAVE